MPDHSRLEAIHVTDLTLSVKVFFFSKKKALLKLTHTTYILLFNITLMSHYTILILQYNTNTVSYNALQLPTYDTYITYSSIINLLTSILRLLSNEY